MSSTHSRRRSRRPAAAVRRLPAVIEAVEGRVLFSTLTINGTAGNDTITFDSTSYTVNGVKTFINATATTDIFINAGNGTDTINILRNRANHNIVAKGGEGFDTFNLGGGKMSSNLLAPVDLDGGEFDEDRVVGDDSLTTGDGLTLSFTFSGFGFGAENTYFGISQFLFKLGSGDDAFFLNSSEFNSNVTVQGGAGDEFFDIGAGDIDKNLHGFARFEGGPGTDGLDLNDFSAPNGLEATISPGTFKSDFTFPITFDAACEGLNINCGDGDDVIRGATATIGFSVDLGFGDDFAQGGTKNDFLQGRDGDDELRGGGGNDTLGSDEFGNDKLFGEAGNDTLDAGEGTDLLDGGEGDDNLIGGSEADVYKFAAAAVAQTDKITEFGGGGADTLDFSALGSTVPVTVNLGSDTLATHTKRTVKTATAGTAKFLDNAVGGAGADSLTGNGGANVLTGNAGADKLFGLAGIDTLFGNAGDDTLDGGDNSDALDGGANNDTYKFTPAVTTQTDTIAELSGGGTDTLDFSALAATDPVTVNLLSNTLATHVKRTVKTKVAGQFAFIENATGGKGNDKLFGNNAINKLIGGLGNDQLTGGGAADSMYGNEGSDKFFAADTVKDFLDGGAGTDSLGSSDAIDTKVSIP